MDLAVAMFARATGLNPRDLTVRFVPTLLVGLSMLSVSASQEIGCGPDTSAPSSYFSFFSAQTFRLFPGCYWAKKVTGLSVTLARRQL